MGRGTEDIVESLQHDGVRNLAELEDVVIDQRAGKIGGVEHDAVRDIRIGTDIAYRAARCQDLVEGLRGDLVLGAIVELVLVVVFPERGLFLGLNATQDRVLELRIILQKVELTEGRLRIECYFHLFLLTSSTAGTPATTTPSRTFLTTAAPAPITDPDPMWTCSLITDPAPR